MVIVSSWLGLSLPTAGIVIGWSMFVLCCFEAVLFILVLKNVPDFAENLVRPSNPNRDVALHNIKMFAYITFSVYLTFVILDMIACLLLTFGVYVDSRFMLVPWLLSNCMSIVFKIISSFFAIIIWILSQKRKIERIVVIILNLLFTGLHIWIWIVIFSLYVFIRDKKI